MEKQKIVYEITADELNKFIDERVKQREQDLGGMTLIIDDQRVPVMTSSEVKEALGVSDVTLWRYANLPTESPKHLSPIIHNKRKYYKREDVDRFLGI